MSIESLLGDNVGARGVVISTASSACIGVELVAAGFADVSSPSDQTWQTANTAIYIPFRITEAMTVYQMGVANGTVASGNVDVGVCNESGTSLVSSGSTAMSGTNTVQAFNVTDTLLVPGRYYLQMSVDNTTAAFRQWSVTAQFNRLMGVVMESSAFPIPATATFAISDRTRLPWVAVFGRSTPAP